MPVQSSTFHDPAAVQASAAEILSHEVRLAKIAALRRSIAAKRPNWAEQILAGEASPLDLAPRRRTGGRGKGRT